eukprot:SAG25_NODE_129_length_14495_cov_41.326202_7_plen_52_part_00
MGVITHICGIIHIHGYMVAAVQFIYTNTNTAVYRQSRCVATTLNLTRESVI